MAQAAGAGHGIEDIYKSVINDVINQVKEAFLDESVDVEVLQNLKKAWEDKLIESGAVDMEGQKVVAVPAVRSNPRHASSSGVQQQQQQPAMVAQSQPPTSMHSTQQQQQQQQQLQAQLFLQQQHVQNAQGLASQQHIPTSIPTQVTIGGQPMMMFRPNQQAFQPVAGSQIQFVPQNNQFLAQSAVSNLQVLGGGNHQAHPQYAIMHGNRMVLVPPNQLPLNLAANPQLLQSIRSFPQQANKQGGSNQMPQLDGSAELLVPSSSGVPKPAKSKKKPTVPQLDGGGPGMTDSSSEEEEEEEDDPLHRYAGLQNVGADDGEGNDEEPLNSGDDQSDEEDLGTLFDSDNVVVCQFEKVHRARSKWKFILKDGIMHLNGKDYCFQKCTGEAEW